MVKDMNILLFGVSNVGKSTIGRILAEKLGYSFYDIDDEIKSFYGYRNIDAFIKANPYAAERDQKRGYIIEQLIKRDDNKVIAVPPIYYTRYYTAYLKKASSEVIRVEIQDTAENIFDRLIFTDENDEPYHDDEYKNARKNKYIKAIKEDIRYFKPAFSKIEHKINIAGLDADKAAAQIISELNL